MEKKNCEGWFRVNGASLKGHNGLTSCTFFHEWNEWKNVQRVRPLWPWKRPHSQGFNFHRLFLFHSVTNISINVRTYMSFNFSRIYETNCPFKGQTLWPLTCDLDIIILVFTILWRYTIHVTTYLYKQSFVHI